MLCSIRYSRGPLVVGTTYLTGSTLVVSEIRWTSDDCFACAWDW